MALKQSRSATVCLCTVVAVLCVSVHGCCHISPGAVRDPLRVVLPYEWGGDIDRASFNEPSGIVFDSQRRTLFVVGDEGDICEMTTDGEIIRQAALRPGADLEGVTQAPGSRRLYVAVEGDEAILEVEPTDFTILREFAIPRSSGQVELFKPGGQGIEAICFVPDEAHPQGGTFFVANQSFSLDPDGERSLLVELEAPLRQAAGSGSGSVRILNWFSLGVIDMSGLHYDAKSGHLLVCCDSANVLLEVTREGDVVRAVAFPGDNQEGLAMDDDGWMYIAQDSGGVVKIKPQWPE